MLLTNFKKFKTKAKQYNAKSDVVRYQVAHWDGIGMPGVWLEQFYISGVMLTFQIYGYYNFNYDGCMLGRWLIVTINKTPLFLRTFVAKER